MAIPKNWYLSIMMLRVEEELETREDLLKVLKSYKSKFIRWSAIQRMNYQDDIDEEYKEFKEAIMNKRLYNTDNKLWKRISKEVFDRDNYTCKYCGQVGGLLEVDHIFPLSKGGTNEIDNLTTSCRRCNRQKKDKTVTEFLEWRNVK